MSMALLRCGHFNLNFQQIFSIHQGLLMNFITSMPGLGKTLKAFGADGQKMRDPTIQIKRLLIIIDSMTPVELDDSDKCFSSKDSASRIERIARVCIN